MESSERLGNFFYISNRLVSGVLGVPELPNPSVPLHADLDIGGNPPRDQRLAVRNQGELGAELLRERATRATRRLRSQTGTIDEPERPYLRLRLDAYMSTFHVPLGWDWNDRPTAPQDQRVMLFASSQVVRGKRLFVGLIGSAHNVQNDGISRPIGYTQGRTPSDIEGLYHLFSEIRETLDANVEKHRVDRNREMSDLRLARETLALAQGSPGDGPPRRVEVLFRRHRPALKGSVSLGNQRHLTPYNLVLIGAPLWIRETVTEDGSPAQLAMDRVGTPAHQKYNEARALSVKLAERAINVNVDLSSVENQLTKNARGSASRVESSDGVAPSREEAEARAALLRSKRSEALDKYAQHEHRVVRDASHPSEWPVFAEWFAVQSALEGIPMVALSVERRPTLWARLFKQLSDAPPEQTDIAGIVVPISPSGFGVAAHYLDLGSYRDALARDWSFSGHRDVTHVLVSPSGEIYPVSLWSFHAEDSRARVVYVHSIAHTGLAREERPTPDNSLIVNAVPAMLEMATRWRITLKRPHPDVPSIDRTSLSQPTWRAGLPPQTVREARIDRMVGEVTSDVDLDS